MPLQRQNVPVQFQGIDTKTDEKSLPLGKLVTLQNMTFEELGKIKKKVGASTLGTTVASGGTAISDPVRVTTYKDELVLITKTRLYSYLESTSEWKDQGPIGTVALSSEQVFNNIENQANVDSATLSGVTVYAWEEGTDVRGAVIDESTGAVILNDIQVAGSSYRPKCIADATNGYINIFYTQGTDLRRIQLDPASPYSLANDIQVLNADLVSNGYYEVIINSSGSISLFYQQFSTNYLMETFAGAGAQATAQRIGSETLTGPISAYRAESGGNHYTYLTYVGTSGNVRCATFNSYLYNFSGTTALGTVESSPGTVHNITNIGNATTSYVFYSITNASTYYYKVRANTFTFAGTAGTAGNYYLGSGLASRAFYDDDSNIYVCLAHESALQPTYFLSRYSTNSEGFVVGVFAKDIAGGLTSKDNSIGHVLSLGSNKYRLANIIKTKLVSEDGETFGLDTVQHTTFEFSNTESSLPLEINDNLIIPSAIPFTYCGSYIVEFGFTLYPENLSAADSTASPAIGAGTRSYVAVFEWYDSKGVRHQSAPSVPLQHTVAAGDQTTITVPTLKHTLKNRTDNSDISIAIYRTKDAGTVYYRVSDITDPVTNNTKLNSVPFVDDQTDTDIETNEILYTQGGALENIHIGAANVIGTYKNRGIFVQCETVSDVNYSKEAANLEAIHFNPALRFSIKDANRSVQAVIEMDEKMVLFTDQDIYIQVGQGPTDSGTLNDYQTPQKVAGDVGSPYPQSVVLMPQGVMFKSNKGYYLLDRGLSVQYIGSGVEDFNSLSVTGAVLMKDENQVRFTHSDGSCLSYDYLVGQWSEFTDYDAISCAVWGDNFVYVDSTGEVFKENDATYLVDSAALLGKLKTGWIKVAGLKGLKRVYAILFTGKYYSAHGLTVKLYYDYSTTATDTFTYTGTSSWDFEIRPTVQQVEAIQIEVIETNSGPTDGASFDITGITLVCGFSPGDRVHLPVSKRVDAN